MNVDHPVVNTIELCAGVGMLGVGVAAGLRHLGIKSRCILFAEREAYPASVLAARIEEGSLDAAPIWFGDFRDAPYAQLRGVVDGIVAGFPCFAAGTSVLTRAGYRPIESLQVGDIVLTHAGNWKPVTSVMRRSGAQLREVRGTGMLPTTTTDEHPYYTRLRRHAWSKEHQAERRYFDAPQWVDASELRGDHFTGQVLPAEADDHRGPAYWWLVGRYLADGWRVDRAGRKNGRVVICANDAERDLLAERISAAGFNASAVQERTVCKFHITRGDFYEFLEQFGRLAHGKTLPGWCLELPAEPARALFDGWASGDGWRNEKQRQVSVTTTSRELALGMALLAQRAYGRVASIHFADMPKKCLIEGRECNQRGQFTVRLADKNRSSFVEDNYGWRIIRGNEPAGIGEVFNISVADDESYIANGAIVHNCQDLSLAGKRAGLDGHRSGLFFDILDAADACGAWFLALENVSGIASATSTVVDEAAAAEITGQSYRPAGTGSAGADIRIHEEDGAVLERAAARVLGELADRGWNAEWLTLSASDVGASHGRERWFCLAWRDMGHTGRDAGGTEHRKQSQITGGRVGKSGSTGGEPDLAHPDGGHGRELARSDQRGLPQEHGSDLDGQLAHAPQHGRHQGRTEPGGEQGRPDAAECGCAMADPSSPGCQGSELGRALHGNRGGGRKHMDQLSNFVAHSSHPALQTQPGPESSSTSPTSPRRLNPIFGAWLMGWPLTWTTAEPSASSASATESFHCALQWHLCFLLGEPDSSENNDENL